MIEAVAGIPEADRALLSLWITHGFDDARLGSFTGVDPSVVRIRRERLVAGLAARLQRSADEVVEELRAMTPPRAMVVADPLVAPDAESLSEPETESSPEPETQSQAQPEAHPPGEPETERARPPEASQRTPGPGRYRGRWAVGAAAVAALVAALLIVLLSPGGSPPQATVTDSRASDPAPNTSTATTTTTTDTTSTTASIPTPAPPSLGAFKGLPGGLIDAAGHVTLLGHGRHLRLRLTVSRLPRPRHGGHYEAWLYTTVLDSRPLGRIRAGHTVTYRLTAGSARFRFIDVSLQPRGVLSHSGESRLRTANPVRQLQKHPRAVRAHPRRALHPAKTQHTTPTRPRASPGRAHHAGRGARPARPRHAHRRGSASNARSTR